jgi:hypothetical protein
MKNNLNLLSFAAFALCAPALTADPIGPIQTVEIRDRAFHVNGKPWFPLMAWLQGTRNFRALTASGMNATAGYPTGTGGTKNVAEYLALVEKAGLLGVMPFDPQLKGHPALLGYIHDDEPDLPRQVIDAAIEPGPGLRIDSKTALWKLVDGNVSSWSVLDPMQGARLTVRLRQPATVTGLGVAVRIAKSLAEPMDVVFTSGGKELLKTTLAARGGIQKFTLSQPATLQELSLEILSVAPGEQVSGALGEIEGYDREGNNVLLCPPRYAPRAQPEETLLKYRTVKAADSTRPLFMTLTGNFHPFFDRYNDEQRAMYPRYVQAADVVGFDIYPIYGWNKPEWIHLVHEATDRLVQMAGPRPVYAWIETSKGSQWISDLQQKEVKPEHIRAEVWMSICRGATAIGYFTHVWKPKYSQFGVPEENQVALKVINDQITRLTPAILGQRPPRTASIESPDGVKLDLLTRQTGADLYLFAVNYDERSRETVAKIQLEGLAAGTAVNVVDENRQLQAQEGAFTDTFAPLAVHIYLIER